MSKCPEKSRGEKESPTVASPVLLAAEGAEKTQPTRDAAVSTCPLGPAGHREEGASAHQPRGVAATSPTTS